MFPNMLKSKMRRVIPPVNEITSYFFNWQIVILPDVLPLAKATKSYDKRKKATFWYLYHLKSELGNQLGNQVFLGMEDHCFELT